MDSPFDYSLCSQTVTVYRLRDRCVIRRELEGCYLQYSTHIQTDEYGRQLERRFLLIAPGQEQLVFADDRIYAGIGPEISEQNWPEFIPAKVEGLMQVQYVKPCFWNGQLCHTEAGRKASSFTY